MFLATFGEMAHIPVKQAMLAKMIPDSLRSSYFAFYGLTGYTASMFAGMIIVLGHYVSPLIVTGLFFSMGLVSVTIFSKLTKEESLEENERSFQRGHPPKYKGVLEMYQKTLYFLGTENTCLTQMAEGWGKHYLGTGWRVISGGVETSRINPMTIEVMNEVGIDISQQTSKKMDPSLIKEADIIITLTVEADRRCPRTPPSVAKVHWGFDHPEKTRRSGEEKRKAFQRVRDEIRARIKQFAETGK